MTTVWELAERIHRVSDISAERREEKLTGVLSRYRRKVESSSMYLVVLGIHRLKSKFFTLHLKWIETLESDTDC